MKALIISPRFPWPPYTGDRLRTTIWLSALAGKAEMTLVSPRGEVPVDAPRFRFSPAGSSLKQGLLAVLALMRQRLPLQCLLAAPYDWHAAISRARTENGPFDITVVLLSRTHPWVHASLEGRQVLDAVDSLRRSAEERSRAAARPIRWFWRMEQQRMAQLESGAAHTYDRVVVLSEDETSDFGEADSVPNGITIQPLRDVPREFDFGFWGRLPYFANRDAAKWLLDEIWPAIRASSPAATLIVGGAEASRALREDARRRGVTLVSPIDDIASFARNIRIALMPLRFGTGQSNKILEAAEAGCAIVGTPQALRGLAPLAIHSRIESTASGFARAAAQLLRNEESRARMGARLREAVETKYARSVTLDQLSAIACAGVGS